MNASLAALEACMGAARFAQWQDQTPNPQGKLEACEQRLLAAVLPNSPCNAAQRAALEQALYAQITADFEGGMEDVPQGVTRLSIGGFSAELDGKNALCPVSRAILLRAGLLYRGVPC